MTSLNSEPLGNLSDKKILAIGGTGGLGRALSLELTTHGARAIVVGRTYRDKNNDQLDFIKADLTSMVASQEVANQLIGSIKDVDVVLFSTGILAATSREETPEGLEKDFAVSFLNRVAILDVIAPKLKPGCRVFIMGFPGQGKLGTPDDLNSEKKYSFASSHMNTVAANEALVLDSVVKYPNLQFYGINPGLVKTNIRDNLFGQGWISYIIESIIGFFTPTPEQYAKAIAPVLFSEKLEDYNGVHVDKNGKLLAGSKGMTTEYAQSYLEKARALLAGVLHQ